MPVVVAVLLAALLVPFSPGVQAGDPASTRELAAMTQRVAARQKVVDDRRALQGAENRQRCESALRVAAACGKFAGTFSCGASGFRPIVPSARLTPVAMDNAARYAIADCARQAAQRARP